MYPSIACKISIHPPCSSLSQAGLCWDCCTWQQCSGCSAVIRREGRVAQRYDSFLQLPSQVFLLPHPQFEIGNAQMQE